MPRAISRVLASATAIGFASACALWAPSAAAQDDDDDKAPPPPPAAPATGPSPQLPANFTVSATRPDPVTADRAPAESPPPRPWSKGLVVEGSLGALGYFGAFRRLAPPSFFQRIQVGYELFNWLMVYGGGELAFANTSIGQDPTKVRAFPIWGFDGGARLTVRPTPRVGIFVQGGVGFMKADVPARALSILGYPDTEELHMAFGGRLGVEWYQIDRHLAFGLAGGPRLATGFERSYGRGDTPLMADGAFTLRYTF